MHHQYSRRVVHEEVCVLLGLDLGHRALGRTPYRRRCGFDFDDSVSCCLRVQCQTVPIDCFRQKAAPHAFANECSCSLAFCAIGSDLERPLFFIPTSSPNLPFLEFPSASSSNNLLRDCPSRDRAAGFAADQYNRCGETSQSIDLFVGTSCPQHVRVLVQELKTLVRPALQVGPCQECRSAGGMLRCRTWRAAEPRSSLTPLPGISTRQTIQSAA